MPLRSADISQTNDAAEEWAGDRRRARRIATSCKGALRASHEATSQPVRVLDVAETGVRIGMRRATLMLGEHVELQLECEVPLRVHLGFDTDALVVDGPLHAHAVRVEGRVTRIDVAANGYRTIGIELDPNGDPEVRAVLRSYVDHVTADDGWAV